MKIWDVEHFNNEFARYMRDEISDRPQVEVGDFMYGVRLNGETFWSYVDGWGVGTTDITAEVSQWIADNDISFPLSEEHNALWQLTWSS